MLQYIWKNKMEYRWKFSDIEDFKSCCQRFLSIICSCITI